MWLVLILSQMNLVHNLHYFFHIFSTKTLHVCYMFYNFFISLSWYLMEEYKLRRLSLCTCLKPLITFYLLVPVTVLSLEFWNMLKLCFSLSVRNPNRTRGTIIILYILILTLLDGRQEDKSYELNGGKCSWDLICP